MSRPPPAGAVRLHPIQAVIRYAAGIGELDRNVRLFLTVTAFRGMVIACLQTVLNLYLYSLGYDARFIGVINGFNSVAVLVVSVPLGYLADRVGRRPILLAGGVLYPLSFLGLSLSTSTPAILLFNFIFGGVAAAYWVAGVPLLFASAREEQRVQAFSLNSFLLWGLGPLGAFLAGQVVEVAARVLDVPASSSTALRAGMFFVVLLAAAGSLPYLFLREPERGAAAVQPPAPGRLAALFAQLLVPDLILSFGLGAVLTFMQLYFHLRFGLDPGPVGLVVGAGGAAAGLATLLAPALARRWGNLRTAVRAQWSAAPLIAVLALSHQLPLALPAYWLVLMLRGMADPVYTAFIQERVPEGYRARLTGLYSVTYSIGYSLGPTASGQLQSLGGFTPAFLMGASCYFCGSTLLYAFFRPRREGSTAIGVS
jgi:MFS family permease